MISRIGSKSLHHLYLILGILYLTTACSPSKEKVVVQQYESAKEQGTIEDAVSLLSELVKINREEYSIELMKAQQAKDNLDKAVLDYQNKQYLMAYTSVHNAYRLFPIFDTKKSLVSSGEALIFLLTVQSKLTDAFDIVSPITYQKVNDYITLPVTDWDLIEINELINQLNTGGQLLQKSVDLLTEQNGIDDSPKLIALAKDIRNKKHSLDSMKKRLINQALSESANVLVTINRELAAESITLYSIVRPSVAKQNLYPAYIKANNTYLPYKILIENLSLADAGRVNDEHADWYRSWSELEDGVINIEHSEQVTASLMTAREKQLNEYRKGNNTWIGEINTKYKSANELLAKHKFVLSTLDKLTRDKAIIHYGLPN